MMLPKLSFNNSFSAERPHDYLYDSIFMVPTIKDVQKAARIAEQRVSQIRLIPNFKYMFSELPHFPQATVVRNSFDYMPANYKYMVSQLPLCNAGKQQVTSEVTGVDRYKYFTSALEPLDESVESFPPLIRVLSEPWQAPADSEPEKPSKSSPLRGSLLETAPPIAASTPCYKHAATQTVAVPRPPVETVIPITGSDVREERLVVRGRAGQLQVAAARRLQLAKRLCDEHATLASQGRADRRNNLCTIWEHEKNSKLSRLLASHNRELRKLNREYGVQNKKKEKASSVLTRISGEGYRIYNSENIALTTLPVLPADTVTTPCTTTTARESRSLKEMRLHPSPWSPSDWSRRESAQY